MRQTVAYNLTTGSTRTVSFIDSLGYEISKGKVLSNSLADSLKGRLEEVFNSILPTIMLNAFAIPFTKQGDANATPTTLAGHVAVQTHGLLRTHMVRDLITQRHGTSGRTMVEDIVDALQANLGQAILTNTVTFADNPNARRLPEYLANSLVRSFFDPTGNIAGTFSNQINAAITSLPTRIQEMIVNGVEPEGRTIQDVLAEHVLQDLPNIQVSVTEADVRLWDALANMTADRVVRLLNEARAARPPPPPREQPRRMLDLSFSTFVHGTES